MIPVVPLLARDMGANEVQLGAISAIPAVTTIVLSLPGNALGLKYGKKTLFLWSQASGVLCGILLLLTKVLNLTLGFVVVPEIVFGISNMLFWPVQSAYITEVIAPGMRARAIGYCMAISSVGSIASPSIAGYLIDHGGYMPIFVLYVGMAAVGVLTVGALPSLPVEYEGSIAGTVVAGVQGVGRTLKKPILQITTMNTFLQFVTLAATEYFLPAFLRGRDYSATYIGATVTVRTAGLTVIRLIVGVLAARLGTIPLLFGGVLACVFSAGLIPVFPNPAYVMVANFLVGIGFGVVPVLTSTTIAENTSASERGMAMALDNASVSVGRTFTGFGIGAVAQAVGFGPAILISNALVLAGAVVTVSRYRNLRRSQWRSPSHLAQA